MGWVGEYPRVHVQHQLFAKRPSLGVAELTVALTPIAVRRPAHGAERTTVECRECGAELDVRIYSARFTRTTKALLLLLGFGLAVAGVVFFLHSPLVNDYETTAEYDAAWLPVLGLCGSFGLMIGVFIAYYNVDGVWLSSGGALHRLTYPASRT